MTGKTVIKGNRKLACRVCGKTVLSKQDSHVLLKPTIVECSLDRDGSYRSATYDNLIICADCWPRVDAILAGP